MNSELPRGLINAVTTPFDAADSVDEGAYLDHLRWLDQAGVAAILVAGTTGEFFSLTALEKLRLLEQARTAFSGHIMFHAGANALKDSLFLAEQAADLGADSVACILPFYLASLEDDGLVRYLSSVSNASDVPFVIYNFPRHTGVRVTPGILEQVPHAGLKDSSADLGLIGATSSYYVGSDRKMLDAASMGGTGFVSARSNAYPALYAQISHMVSAGNLEGAAALHPEVMGVCDVLSGPRQIALVKQAIASQIAGYPTRVRLPLC